MQAFHNDQAVKEKYLNRVRHHQKADHLIRGKGWENGKGCAVGCTLEAYDHKRYETELGIPEWLARLEDELFEGMTLEKSRTWPEKFLESIVVGSGLNSVKTPFIIMLLENNIKSMDACVFDLEKNPEVVKALELSKSANLQMIEAQKSGDEALISAARSAARSAAWSAAWSAAESAAWSAAWSAAESAARSAAESAAWSARSAAWSATESARSAAESARSAAWSAARSARSAAESAAWSAAESARSAAESARSAAFDYYADELLRLLRELK